MGSLQSTLDTLGALLYNSFTLRLKRNGTEIRWFRYQFGRDTSLRSLNAHKGACLLGLRSRRLQYAHSVGILFMLVYASALKSVARALQT